MKILEELKKRAQSKDYTIVLPEANMDERVKNACVEILRDGLSKIIVFGSIDEFSKEFRDKVDYYCRVTLTKEEFEEITDKCRFALELSKNGGRNVTEAVKMVGTSTLKKWTHWDIKKLRERVEKGTAEGGKE
jgi:phosphotransacetylase